MLPVLRPTPNREDQVSVLMSPSDEAAQLYPQVLGSLYVAFYDWQGVGAVTVNIHSLGTNHFAKDGN
jgi:hypothetical protein